MDKSSLFISEFEVTEPIFEHEKYGSKYILKTIEKGDQDKIGDEYYTFEGTNKHLKTLFFMLMHPQNYTPIKINHNGNITKINL